MDPVRSVRIFRAIRPLFIQMGLPHDTLRQQWAAIETLERLWMQLPWDVVGPYPTIDSVVFSRFTTAQVIEYITDRLRPPVDDEPGYETA